MRTSFLIVAATLLVVVPAKAQILKRPELFVDSEHVAGISANDHYLLPGESMVFDVNETVVLTAYEGDDFYGWFERWSGDVGGMTNQNPITIVMDSDKFITAHYSFGNAGEEYYLSSLNVTPGAANVTSAAQTLSFQIDYTSMQGGVPGGSVTLRPPSPLFPPIVVDLSLTTLAPDEWGLGGTFSFSREFPTGTLSGQWTVDVVFEDFASFTQYPFFAAGSFVVQDNAIGGAADNPVIPDEVTADGGFRFGNIPAGTPMWIDPPMAFGYLYEVDNAATITGIANFPTGIDGDGKFTISAPSFEKQVDVSDAVDFVAELGAGTKWFTITGIEPGADAADAQAFPIRVAFDSAATLRVTPLLLPELGIAVANEAGEMVATLSWEGQDELDYQLYRTVDLKTWQPVGSVIAGTDGPQSAQDRSGDRSVLYRLGLIVPAVTP